MSDKDKMINKSLRIEVTLLDQWKAKYAKNGDQRIRDLMAKELEHEA